MSRGKSADKKKPARVASGPEAPGFARSLGENTGRILRLFLPLALMVAVVAGLSFVLWRCVGKSGVVSAAEKTDSSDARARLTGALIRQAVLQNKRPAWISKEDFDQAAELGMFAQGHSVFEAGLSHALAERYQTSPWVECVRAVRLRFPAQMELELDWRKPAARLDRPSMVLDRQGVVLNLMADNAAVRDIPLVTGLVPARTEVGKKAGEKELLEALELIATVRDALTSSPGQLKVASVQREAAGTWRIITDRGPCVYWGYYTDDPPMDEPRTREKVSLLRRRLCEMKDPALFEYVKVYHAQAPVRARGTTGSGDTGAPVVTQINGPRPRR